MALQNDDFSQIMARHRQDQRRLLFLLALWLSPSALMALHLAFFVEDKSYFLIAAALAAALTALGTSIPYVRAHLQRHGDA